jgi:hypothetical protein
MNMQKRSETLFRKPDPLYLILSETLIHEAERVRQSGGGAPRKKVG